MRRLRQNVWAVDDGSGSFRTVKHKPRNVLDLRHKRHATFDDIHDALTRYMMKRAVYPDTIRVHPGTKFRLTAEFRKYSGGAAWSGTTAGRAPSLRIFGVKVTL